MGLAGTGVANGSPEGTSGSVSRIMDGGEKSTDESPSRLLLCTQYTHSEARGFKGPMWYEALPFP